MTNTSTELTIVIPIFNERDNIEPLIEVLHKALANIEWEIIFVDDDSPDGSASLVRDKALADRRIRCIQRIGRRGLSSACIEGILASSSDYVAVMDADMQHDENLLPKMLKLLQTEDYDIVVGSRYVEGGSMGELQESRVFISRMASKASRSILKSPLTDPMSGFFMLRRSFFAKAVYDLSGKGFKFLLDLFVSSKKSVKFFELPYDMRARQHGESKLGVLVIWEYLFLLADKLIGKYIPVRFVLFVGVGSTGLVIHLIILGVCLNVVGFSFMFSQTIATIIAMTNNFLLNNWFTYHDKRLEGKAFYKGILSFYLACSIGAFVNIQVANFIFGLSAPWWIAGIIGGFIGSVWNYAITATFTWKKSTN